MLSSNTVKRLLHALTSRTAGLEMASALDLASASAAADQYPSPAAIVATSTSTTVDFAALAVGDILLHIPATAGNAAFEVVATAGAKPSAAVVGDLYLVLRKFVAPAARTDKL